MLWTQVCKDGHGPGGSGGSLQQWRPRSEAGRGVGDGDGAPMLYHSAASYSDDWMNSSRTYGTLDGAQPGCHNYIVMAYIVMAYIVMALRRLPVSGASAASNADESPCSAEPEIGCRRFFLTRGFFFVACIDMRADVHVDTRFGMRYATVGRLLPRRSV